MLKDIFFLDCLRTMGVDNWEGDYSTSNHKVFIEKCINYLSKGYKDE
jgi:hypothetical protein